MFYLFTSGTDDAQLVNSPDGNDNQSDYEADDEASLLPSPADTNASGGELDDSEHGDIGQISLGNFEFFSSKFLLCQFYPHIVVILSLSHGKTPENVHGKKWHLSVELI